MLKNIFLDLDDTILNFTAGEAKALSQTLREAGIEPTVAILDRYHIINTAHWELLEEAVSPGTRFWCSALSSYSGNWALTTAARPSASGMRYCSPASMTSCPVRSSF